MKVTASFVWINAGESSVNWFPDFFRWRNLESSGQSVSALFHHVHVSLSWYIWYTKMKFAATKLITSKSQTKSKIIPNQELSISPKFNGKKRCSKASKTRQPQQKSSWSIHLETWKFKKTNAFWAQTFPRWNLYLPKKKTLPKPKLHVLMNIAFAQKDCMGPTKTPLQPGPPDWCHM